MAGMANAQPPIANPTPYTICDDNSDGFQTFNLHSKDSEILNSLSSSLYRVSYHTTLADAQNNLSSVLYTYTNTVAALQILYVRVHQNSNTANFSTTTLDLRVNPMPNANTPTDMEIVQTVFTGTATFDLTSQLPTILGGQTGLSVSFHNTQADASNSTNPFTSPTAYTNTSNPQRIWYRSMNTLTGCFAVSSFLIKVTNPNVVYIPDANFKSVLLNHSPIIDTNADGEIQTSEAQIPTVLNLAYTSYITTDFTGLLAFTGLQNLNISNNKTTSLDLTGLTNLVTLDCRYSETATINVSGLTNLQDINCDYSSMSSINLSGCINLQTLLIGVCNNLTSINLTGLNSLRTFTSYDNHFSSLNFSNFSNLETIGIGQSPFLSTLILTGCSSLQSIDANNCPISNMNTTGLTNLQTFNCRGNRFSSFDARNLTSLQTLDLSDGQNLSFINASGLANLQVLNCSNSSFWLSNIDLTGTTSLQTLDCHFDDYLSSIFIKNGRNENLNLYGCTNLRYICADNSQLANVQALAPTATVNSYCSFIPASPYNTITGTTRLDINSNGCDVTDPIFKNLRVNLNDGIETSALFSGSSGTYTFYVQTPTNILTPWFENPTYFNVTPATATLNFPTNNNSTQTQDFCISANGVHNDLEVVLVPIGGARPGFDASYKLVYKNKGNQTLSGVVNLLFDDARTDFVSAIPTVDSQAVNALTWNYANLLPFEVRAIDFVVNLNSPLETPPLNSGDYLDFSATITPLAGDELPSDNVFSYHQTVVNSYDPNDKTCLEGSTLTPDKIGEYLHYNINFENTGSASAINVVIKDVIDTTMFDIETLQVISTSHSVKTEVKGNNVEFIFQNINLAAGNPGGHGNVLFKIKSKPNLTVGGQVANTANIYFDYNAPIITNEARTTFAALSNSEFDVDQSVNVYPNPGNSIINIRSNNNIKNIQLFDIQGRVLQTVLEDKTNSKIDISNHTNGIYFLKISTDKGIKVEKIVKE